MVQLERFQDRPIPPEVRVLLLTYEGMKPTAESQHAALVEGIGAGSVLILFGHDDTTALFRLGGIRVGMPIPGHRHISQLPLA